MANITIDPLNRIEGHLGIELMVDGSNIVTDVQAQGKMFRGFELILANRNPRDAVILTQRI